jgi:hypothetical protein
MRDGPRSTGRPQAMGMRTIIRVPGKFAALILNRFSKLVASPAIRCAAVFQPTGVPTGCLDKASRRPFFSNGSADANPKEHGHW